MKTTFYVDIGTAKFATQLTKSPCSPEVTFPSFSPEGHGVQPPQGDSVFSYYDCVTIPLIFFMLQSFLFSVLTYLGGKKTFSLKENIKIG